MYDVREHFAMVDRWSGSVSRVVVLVAVLIGSVFVGSEGVWLHASPHRGEPGIPVLVELFTSEGCSSCPPADELLIQLEERQPIPGAQIIVVSEHVDYWDDLGWRDPFSSMQFTERQDVFRKALGEPANYTPQLVIDGHVALIGSLEAEARQAVALAVRRPKASMYLELREPSGPDDVTVHVRIAELPGLPDGETADLWFAVTETGLTTNVARGENARRRLRHTAVARHLERAERLPAAMPEIYDTTIPVALAPAWRRDHLRVVVFLQEAVSRNVVGAAQVALGP